MKVRIQIIGGSKAGKTSLARIIEHALKPFVTSVDIKTDKAPEIKDPEMETPLVTCYSNVANTEVLIEEINVIS